MVQKDEKSAVTHINHLSCWYWSYFLGI